MTNIPNLAGRVDPIVEAAIRELYSRIDQVSDFVVTTPKKSQPTVSEIANALSSSGSNPLNITGLVGLLSQPQKALVSKVTSLPTPAQSINNQSGNLLLKGGILYIYDTSTNPGQWIEVAALGTILYDTHANRSNYDPIKLANGAAYYETDRQVLYINQLVSSTQTWVYATGVFQTTFSLRPGDLGTNDTGFIVHVQDNTTGSGQFYSWNGTIWTILEALGVLLQDTHANRSSYIFSSYAPGTMFFETDRHVLYQQNGSAWEFVSGVYIAATGSRPADLGSTDVGFLFVDSTLDQLEYWNGSSWVVINSPNGGVNAQTTNYTFAASDYSKLVTFNGTSITGTLPTPPSSTWYIFVENLNNTSLTISRGSVLINGGTSNITLQQYQWTVIYTDGSNYFAKPPVTAGTNITLTMSSAAETLAAASSGSGGGVNAQTTNYTPISSDSGKLITMSGSTLTFTLPNAPLSSTFWCAVENLNASPLTISRNSLTINGGTSNLTLQQFDLVFVWTDGSNYFTSVLYIQGSGVNISPSSSGATLSASSSPPGSWSSYTPTLGGIGSTSLTSAAKQQFGKLGFVRVAFTAVGNSSNATVTLPYTPASTDQVFAISFYDSTGNAALPTIQTISGSTLTIGANLTFGHNCTIVITGVFETT